MGVYVNPVPSEEEKRDISSLQARVRLASESTNKPLIVMGDFNDNGHKMMKEFPMDNILKGTITRVRKE